MTAVDAETVLTFKSAVFETIGYKPHEGQHPIHFDDWTYFVCAWGRRAGKTHAAAGEAIAQLAIPDRRIWVVAPNYILCEKVFREVWDQVVLKGALGNPNKVITHKRMDPRGGTMVIRTAWGSWIEGKSAENPNSLVGEGLDLLIIDEAAKVKPLIWEKYLEPTLVDRKGRALMISTPEGHNWFWEAFERGQTPSTAEKGWRCSTIKSEDNPYLDQSWIEQKRSEVTPEIFRQEYEASFEHHTGLVFKDFRNKLHPGGHLFNDDIFSIGRHLSHYRAIDPGLDNPTACIWAAVDEYNNVYVYDEYQVSDVLVDTHASNINVKTVFPIENTYIGHDAARTSPTDGLRPIDLYQAQGIYCEIAPRNVEAGIQTVARYFRATLEANPSSPRLYIHEDCRELRAALTQLVWDPRKANTDLNSPDRIRKRNDHLPDALRYLLATEPIFLGKTLSQPVEAQPRRPPPRPGRPTTGL